MLWVFNTGTRRIRRVNLETRQPDADFPIALFSADFDVRLAALPGNADGVLVKANGAVSVYSGGAPLPYTANAGASVLIATYSPSLAYAFNSNSTAFDFSTICLNGKGAFVQQNQTELFAGFENQFTFVDGAIYSSSGTAYDIASRTILGRFTPGTQIAVDPAARRIFTVPSFSTTISAIDLDTFVARGTETFPAGDFPWGAQLFVRWGRYGFALRPVDVSRGAKPIYLMRSSLIP
jgi:hypothetical protein